MKKLVTVIALLFTTSLFAQIEIEHVYDSSYRFSYQWVDSNEMMYTSNDGYIVTIYRADHSLYRIITLPRPKGVDYYPNVSYFTKHLFNNDDKIEFLAVSSPENVFVYNENGDSLFSCIGCISTISQNLPAITNTPNGTKMFLYEYKVLELPSKVSVYSLPGKLPTSNTKLSATDAPTIISSSSPSTSAYPNPSNGKIRVAYSLPEGVTTGELLITTTDGREVKRYRVGNMFNDVLIEKSELPSGAYFYKLVTERGESESRKFVITN
jgi:hypothetical protein